MRDAAVPGESKALVGDQGVWVFIAADLMLFLSFFTMYGLERLKQVEVFRASQAMLDPVAGGINTLVLLTSSWLVAVGVHRARAGRSTRGFIGGALLFGGLFIAVKLQEYAHLIGSGASMTDNGFFMYYFITTGMHLLHVLIGLAILIYLLGKQSGTRHRNLVVLESGGAYWHMVDLLWLFIFPLFYLLV